MQPLNHGAVQPGAAAGPEPARAPAALRTAVDLGSNSFCLLQARVGGGDLEVERKMRRSVRLMAAIDAHGELRPNHLPRVLDCLRWFAGVTRPLAADTVRVVATAAVRRLRAPAHFLAEAGAVLGQRVQLIAAAEEARLIWLGASSALPAATGARLVADVGGGSTELILGDAGGMRAAASLRTGCVHMLGEHFADGVIDAARWAAGVAAARALILALPAPFPPPATAEAWASSGSARDVAIGLRALGGTGSITPAGVAALRARFLRAGHVSRLRLPALERRATEVMPGTLVILEALQQTWGIAAIQACPRAMREGILLDLAPS